MRIKAMTLYVTYDLFLKGRKYCTLQSVRTHIGDCVNDY